MVDVVLDRVRKHALVHELADGRLHLVARAQPGPTTLVYVRPGRIEACNRAAKMVSSSCEESSPDRARGPGRSGRPSRRPSAAALTATDIRIGSHPAFVRIVVEFTGGRLQDNQTLATDPNPSAGRSAIEADQAGIDTDAAPDSAYGVEAISSTPGGSSCTRARSAATSSTCSYESAAPRRGWWSTPWKAKPSSADAEFPTAPNRAPLARLSEDRVVLGRSWERKLPRARSALLRASVRARAPQPAGRTRAHGSGDLFREETGTTFHSVGRAAAGNAEAVSFSAKDGAVDCIAQVRVTLKPV